MQRVLIYMVGTAGSGKTYLTKAFSEWLDLKRLDNIIVNLDPGAENLPYAPDVDVRDWFTLDDIMVKYGVGPNGAQIIGADLVGAEIDEIKDEIDYHDAPYVIIDTPGQMELFTLRRSSEIIINVLGRKESVMVFLFDPVISKTPSGYLSILFMATSAVFRLGIPQIPVLSKCDLLGERELEKILAWSNPDELYLDLSEKGVTKDLFHVMRESGFFRPLIPVSAVTGYGMDDIYDCIQEIFYGGEDLERVLY
ncbi:ATP/GTP-binding protein [Archaeoglobus veneficus]|uniref:GTPase n=1 Tax=Archaeoglobus veneficus (strain DSM 11195 / SNP6) TaxID=693661 RepID=F2KMX0_ARCVS|nr:ATP/GTP-binding protein [Archaeoglobus veneficus]AEA47246.1 protein of unknown function ATP binding protein [Archaeoglobus veneficus SNP6]